MKSVSSFSIIDSMYNDLWLIQITLDVPYKFIKSDNTRILWTLRNVRA